MKNQLLNSLLILGLFAGPGSMPVSAQYRISENRELLFIDDDQFCTIVFTDERADCSWFTIVQNSGATELSLEFSFWYGVEQYATLITDRVPELTDNSGELAYNVFAQVVADGPENPLVTPATGVCYRTIDSAFCEYQLDGSTEIVRAVYGDRFLVQGNPQ